MWNKYMKREMDIKVEKLDHQKDIPLFSCEKCKISVSREDYLNEHKSCHKLPARKLYSCVECPKTFERQYRLASHKRSKHTTDETKPHKCTQCSKSFLQLENLEIHKGTHNVPAGSKIIQSEVSELDENCTKSKITHSKISLFNVDVMTNNKLENRNYPCNQCNVSFSHGGNLKLHQMTHTLRKEDDFKRINIFLCNICQKSFSEKDKFRLHHKSHTETNNPTRIRKLEHFPSEKTKPNIGFSAQNATHLNESIDLDFKKEINLDETNTNLIEQRSYQCMYPGCDNIFETASNLWTHAINMHKENSKFCPVCSKGCRVRRDLARHVRIHDESKFDYSRYLPNKMIGMLKQGAIFQFDGRKVRADFICNQCGKIFERQSEKSRHIKYVHAKSYKCSIPFCAKSFETEISLTEHSKQNICDISEKKFQCGQCDESFSILDVLKDHSRKHIDKPNACETCGNKFSSIDSLNVHLFTHTILNEIPCDLCNETFSEEYLLRRHKTNFHGIEAKKITCSDCGKICNNKHNLNRHMLKHSNLKNFMCNLCGKALKEEKNLKLHMRRHSGEKNYHCDQCEASYFTSSAFRNHKVSKHREGPPESFLCTYCGISKNSKHRLKLHITLHTGEKKLKCSYSEKRFRNHSVREGHEKSIHTGVKNYVCEYCSKAFVQKHQLKVHTARHTGERRHICPDCNKTFIEPGDVRKHMKVHHKNSEYKRIVKPKTPEQAIDTSN